MNKNTKYLWFVDITNLGYNSFKINVVVLLKFTTNWLYPQATNLDELFT